MNRDQLESVFKQLGLARGDTVFAHSSLSSIGRVEGGAEAVVDALLGVLGSEGTLAVPTFTFDNDGVLFDPRADPSGMGRISEAVRLRPQALRSVHRFHSVAAMGRHAATITAVHGPSAWAGDGPFWQFYALDARILLLGVSYHTCTFFHLIEQLLQVSYRQWEIDLGQVRQADGRKQPWTSHIFAQTPDSPGNDFNKFGAVLEERGLVGIGTAGNAIARLFKAGEALREGVECYRRDPMIFARSDGQRTLLRDGVEIANARSVVDPEGVFSGSGPAG
ncbi:MAG: hypothetical protein GKR89_03025 [Candidatus Latescibacteria bacterium]|nr:hypothetical protein [Candidatus Latescibacterota bacterium]